MDDDTKLLLKALLNKLDVSEVKKEPVQEAPKEAPKEDFSMEGLAKLIAEQQEAQSAKLRAENQEYTFNLFLKQKNPDFVAYLSEQEDSFGEKALERIKAKPVDERYSMIDKLEQQYHKAMVNNHQPASPQMREIKKKRDEHVQAYESNEQKLKSGEVNLKDYRDTFWKTLEQETATALAT